MSFFDTPLKRVVGSDKFAKAGLHTVRDLLNNVPRTMHQYGELTQIAGLPLGADVTVLAQIADVRSRHARNGHGWVVEVELSDMRSGLTAAFFPKNKGYHAQLLREFKPGELGYFSGKVRIYQGQRQLTHPAYRMLRDGEDPDVAYEEHRNPDVLYRKVGRLESWHFRSAVAQVLAMTVADDFPEVVPAPIREAQGLNDPWVMYRALHEPQSHEEFECALADLRFQEAFVLQAELVRRRALAREALTTARPRRAGALLDAFDAASGLELTRDQARVGEEIARELAQPTPMLRLLQGDVGTGKTLVALRAMLQVVDAGGQAALLAPTEVLATQHARSIAELLGPLATAGTLTAPPHATAVTLLTAALTAAQRRQALADIASGSARIVVGTHALLSQNVSFFDLGLVVVDEQHRFGVEQRDVMRARAGHPVHSLFMTATPIPRTVAMTVFGDLETSTLTERPAGGAGSDTFLIGASNGRYMYRVWETCRQAVDAGERVYVVCPRIDQHQPAQSDDEQDGGPEPSEEPDTALSSVAETAERLRKLPQLAGVEIGVLHSRMSPDAKDAAMAAFVSGAAPVLVATTVVEVGVDVPAATRMVILDADRFGLSQLHQLRGRIGRGARRGMCFAVSRALDAAPRELQSDLAHAPTADETATVRRLRVFATTDNGFELAEEDLRLRREGDVLGALQHGSSSSLSVLRVSQDVDVIQRARTCASELLQRDPELAGAPDLAAELTRLEDSRLADFLEMS